MPRRPTAVAPNRSVRAAQLPHNMRMTGSVYQRVLGSEFDKLAPELRPYFTGDPVGLPGLGSGAFEVAGSPRRALRPVLAYLGWRHILFPEYARNVPFDVVNTPGADGSLSAVRTLHFAGGRDRVLEDTMRVVDGRLHDFLGRRRGLEARFELAIDGGMLRMRSDRLWLRLAGARIRLPRIATVTLAESWTDGDQHVDVRLRSPLLGEWFRYSGSFSYRYQAR
jgi:Domain of unknown function (DUF4166)